MRDEQMTVTISDEDAVFVREQVGLPREERDVLMDKALSNLQDDREDVARMRAELDEAESDPRRIPIEDVKARFERLLSEEDGRS